MSATEELTKIAASHTCCSGFCAESQSTQTAKAILEAGYRKVVNTKADLDALPVGAKIRDNRSESLIKDESAMWALATQPNELFASWEMEFGLPAVVLLEGDAA